AENLLRPVGYERGALSAAERDTLLDLAESSSERVRLRFLEQALEGPATAVRLARRSELAVHAAVGLDPERRERVVRLLVRKLQDEQTAAEVREACVHLGIGLGTGGVVFC